MICGSCAVGHGIKSVGMVPAKVCALCRQTAHSPHPVRRERFEQLQRELKAEAKKAAT